MISTKQVLFLSKRITFRDQASGQIREIPISAVAKKKNNSGFSAIKHDKVKRVVLLYSALAPGGNATAIVNQIQKEMENFPSLPATVDVDYTGEIEEQNKQQSFLIGAFYRFGIDLLYFNLSVQFSFKARIIMLAIFLSLIESLVESCTGDSFIIMMTMMGIISLAGLSLITEWCC